MIVNYYQDEDLYSISLPEKPRGHYWLDEKINSKPYVEIEAVGSEWTLHLQNEELQIINGDVTSRECVLESMSIYYIVKNGDVIAQIYCELSSNDRQTFARYCITDKVTIGRSSQCSIQYDNDYVSKNHMMFQISNGSLYITDMASRNGTYVNGKRVSQKLLNIGDVINLFGFKIIVGPGFIEVNCPDGKVHINQNTVLPYVVQRSEVEACDSSLFYRSPRFTYKVENKQFVVEGPPKKENNDEVPLVFVLGPSITMGMASVATASFSVSTAVASGSIKTAIPSIIMATSMVLGTVLWPIISQKFAKKKKKRKEIERREKYTEYLKRLESSIDNEIQAQTKILIENSIDVQTCKNRIMNHERKLWERGINQDDFLKLRVGTGNVALSADFDYPKRAFNLEIDDLNENMLSICERNYYLKNVPVEFSFSQNAFTGVVGNKRYVDGFIRGLILETIALYSYKDVKLCIIYQGNEFDFTKLLPHVWNSDHSLRLIARDKDDVRELSSFLEGELDSVITETGKETMLPDCRYVIICLDTNLGRRCSALNRIQKIPYCGFSIIYGYNRIAELPEACTSVFEIEKEKGVIYNREVFSKQHQEFMTSMTVDFDMGELSKRIANIHLSQEDNINNLPTMISFLDMYGVKKIEHLNIPQRWKESNPVKTLEAPIGVDAYGDLSKLNLHEKYHGPHGLVAGMTGSGKSEFIMTYILSLAINYHPYEVSFILIDYKGGGMAKAFEHLPHTAGIITNLDGSAVNRSLISIQSELMRRQALFGETAKKVNISNIDIYKYQQLYRSGEVEKPLSHLFIISDEFAELKMQQPEFMKQLMSASRIGRSLGVHLILATQKPAGVVDDQIWSNSRFHVCLKVQDRIDSMDMLKRPEAASLKETGRYYLQVGYDEMFEMGQSAWSGDGYNPSDEEQKNKNKSIDVIDTIGHVIKSGAFINDKANEGYQGKQLDCIVKYMNEYAKEEGVNADQLWMAPLCEQIIYEELVRKYNFAISEQYALTALIGEIDDPRNQQQYEYSFSFSHDGNLAIYGMAGAGKTTMLYTLIYSLLEQYNADQIEFHLMDFASETLSSFKNAPQVRDVIYMPDEDKIEHLFGYLQKTMSERKTILAEYGGSFDRYNTIHEDKMRSIVVVLHNYMIFREEYEKYEQLLARVARDGEKYGIYFVMTAMADGEIRSRVMQTIKQVIVLQMNDALEYTMILGRTEGMLPTETAGRGLLRINGELYEMQCAMVSHANEQYEFIEQYCNESASNWYKQHKRERIAYLEETIEPNASIKNTTTSVVPVTEIAVPEDITEQELLRRFIKKSGIVLSRDEKAIEYLRHLARLMKGKEDIYVVDLTLGEDVNVIIKQAYDKWMQEPDISLTIVLLGYHEIVTTALSVDSIGQLSELLEADELTILLADQYDKFKPHYYASWCEKHLSGQDGIWLGDGLYEQYIIRPNPAVLYREVAGAAYFVDQGEVYSISMKEVRNDE